MDPINVLKIRLHINRSLRTTLLILGLVLNVFPLASEVNAASLQQTSSDTMTDTVTVTDKADDTHLYLPIITASDSHADATIDGTIIAASAQQQSSVLYTKYLYSRWSNPNSHYKIQMSGCGLLISCSVQNGQNVATMNLSDYSNATVSGIGLFSSIGKVAWADLEQTAAAGDYAGWQISNANFSNLSNFRNSYLRTYLKGKIQEEIAISTLTDVGLIDTVDGGQSVVFQTKKSFDRVEIVLDSNLLGLSLFNSIQFYYAFAAKMKDVDRDNLADIFDSDIDGDGLSNTIESCILPGSLNYDYYNLAPSGFTVNNIPIVGADQSGVVSNLNVNLLQQQISPFDTITYAMRYSAILNVPYEDNFTFYLESEGGSAMWIDDNLTVDNDGWHGNQERSGTVHLTPGYHMVRLSYFKYLSGNGFMLRVSGTALPKSNMPLNIFLACDPQIDSDGDGIPNAFDMDSDNDTIPDAIEAHVDASAISNAQVTTNVAFGKATRQSTTYSADGVASHAADGNTDGNFANRSVTHTNYEVNPWWQVDLGSTTSINSISLWNRTDCCSARLTNFFVFVANYDMSSKIFGDLVVDNSVWRYSLGTTAPTTLNIPVNANGRFVRVQLAGTDYLQLAEVQVFAQSTGSTSPGLIVADFENGTLGMFAGSSGAGITTDAYAGKKAAIVNNTGNKIGIHAVMSPGTPVSLSAWVKGKGTAYVSFASSNFSEIANVYRSVNTSTWQQVTFTGIAPAGTVYYDLIFRSDNGSFLVDNVKWTTNQ